MRALIVDDEPFICMMIEDVLLRAGWEVTIALSGQQALDVLSQAEGGSALDLAVVDLGLPDMPGARVVDAARCRLPLSAIVVCTGYGASDPPVARLPSEIRVLHKPCDYEALLVDPPGPRGAARAISLPPEAMHLLCPA